MNEADFAGFDTLPAELDDNDTKQENAKKKQKQATKVRRDESLAALKKLVKKMRNKAKVIFEKKPMILNRV